jgi:very-short-patch-repair endonuclease
MSRQQDIRSLYRNMLPSIIENYPHVDTNFIDWTEMMSIAEKLMWVEIKSMGLPMYPQFPVLGYFIDFADPVKKVGIEVDGREFHTDWEADEKRQKEMEALGWTFYRITGSEVQPFHRHEKSAFINDDYVELDPARKFLLKIRDNHYPKQLDL